MVEVDSFLTALYVMVDDFHKSRPKERRRPGPDASLCESEIVTLAIFSRFSQFASERDFYRYAQTHLLRDAFPTLPSRSQFNRSVRSHVELIEEVALYLADTIGTQRYPYQALNTTAMPGFARPRQGRQAKGRGMAGRSCRHRMEQSPGMV